LGGHAHLFLALTGSGYPEPGSGYRGLGISQGNPKDIPAYRGFVVVRPELGFTGNRSLHIWAAYSENSGLDERLAEIEEMAREQGFNQVTFSSPRKGWARRLKSYQPTYQVFRKVL
jgi:hypothetical protein